MVVRVSELVEGRRVDGGLWMEDGGWMAGGALAPREAKMTLRAAQPQE